MMKHKFLTLCILTLLASAVSAGEVVEKGAYIGAAIGTTEFDDDGAFNGLDFDDSDSSFEIFGGYRFMKYFAVEARLMSLGEYRVEFLDIEAAAVSLHAVGIFPFGQSGWELFGQLGLGRINLDVDVVGDEDETVGSAGLGLRFTPIRNMSIAFRLDAFAWEDDNLDQDFDASIGTAKFAVQYNF